MSYFVATSSFLDPTDNQPVIAGRTVVAPEADCYRLRPQAFKPVERGSLGMLGGEVTRVGGVTGFHRAGRQRTPSRQRPALREVELREHHVDYSVSLGSSARSDILAEIKRAHRAAGQDVEAAGWLFGQYRPRADRDWTEVALATRSTERAGTRGEVFLSDPFEAIAAVRNAGYPHLELLGDWHSHTVRGSELPSLGDARAWAGTMDKLGRSAYVSLLVAPGEELGWMTPKFSAWIAGRYGQPSTPVVGRATLR
jgi:hypothetical protein